MHLGDAWGGSVTEWVEWLRAQGRPRTTVYTRTYQLRRFAADHPDGPTSVGTRDLIHWLGAQQCGSETLAGYRAALRVFFTWAHTAGVTEQNPSRDLPAIRLPRGKPRPAPEDVYQAALERADDRVRLMLRLGREAGLRRDEIARVHRGDLVQDLAGWSLRVTGKGGHQRYVPLVDDLAEQIAAAAGWVFPGRTEAGHLSRYQVGRLLREKALQGQATPHQLRHAAATRVYRASGSDIRVTQEFLGHASVATTQRYVRVDQDAIRAAVISAA